LGRAPAGVNGIAQRDVAVDTGVSKIAYGGETTFQIFACHLRAEQNTFSGRFDDCQQEPWSKVSVIVARALGFRGHNYVDKQVSVTVDKPRQQGRAAEVDRFNVAGCVSLNVCRRTNFFDFAVFNQHRGWRKNIPGTRIEQASRFYESCSRRRLSGQLRSS
jgi:hypothetical protein